MIVPLGWTRGESVLVKSYAPVVVFARLRANPFTDPPATQMDKTLTFDTPQEANAWIRWWFAA